MKIGEKIRMVRTTKGLSQENLAEMLGISLVAYSKIERNETEVGYNRLEQIAKVFDMKVHELAAIGEPGVVFQFNKIEKVDGAAFSTTPIVYLNNDAIERIKALEERVEKLEKKP
jgi:transcriptional regulator with XRE-family HTH domain